MLSFRGEARADRDDKSSSRRHGDDMHTADPYWSFHVSKATLHIDHYAYMRNAAFKTGRMPVIYLPYLIWPMKKDRSTGCFCQRGYSRRRGSSSATPLPRLGRSQDATFYFDKYGQTGTGWIRVPIRPANAVRRADGYYLNDTVTNDQARTSGARDTLQVHPKQKFDNGFSLLADLNQVSDLDYYLDFERDITQTTSPTVFSHVDLVRNWRNYSSTQMDRQEQFLSTSSDVTLQRLPEIEMRDAASV